nr:hypothetical protein [Tanacetum cinerariifolium]
MTKFDDDARARLCQSSGSEHSSNNSITNLSELVDSFFEDGCCDRGGSDIDDDVDDVCTKRAICYEVESVCRMLEDCSSDGFKRSLMSLLRQRGYDA